MYVRHDLPIDNLKRADCVRQVIQRDLAPSKRRQSYKYGLIIVLLKLVRAALMPILRETSQARTMVLRQSGE